MADKLISELDAAGSVAATDLVETETPGSSSQKATITQVAASAAFSDAYATAAQGGTADSALQNVVEDTTPALGGQLDVNGQALGDGTLEILKFGETASAVNEVTVTNAATGAGPTIAATGDDAAVDLNLASKSTGVVAITGVVTLSSTIDGRDLATDGSKLDTIETSATADQSNAEIKTAYEANADTNALTDAAATVLGNTSGTNTGDEAAASATVAGVAELATIAEVDTGTDTGRVITPAGLAGSALQSKVDGIEAGADVTDTANVTAAGALMDSEVDADLKTLVLPASTTITAAAATVLDDATVAAMLDTLGGASATGTGGVVRATSPTLVTPALGTPSAIVLTNATGTAASLTVGATTGVEAGADVTDAVNVAAAGAPIITSGAGAPVSTPAAVGDIYVDTTGDDVYAAAGTASSADWKQATGAGGGDLLAANNLSDVAVAATALTNLGVTAAAQTVTDDATVAAMVNTLGGATSTGTGGLVRATSPTLVTPALGTPSALVGTNITGTAAGLTVGATTGVEAGADVTDTANVTAAGALMDSEVDADLKTLVLPANTTITAAAATVLDDATVAAMVDTLGGATTTGTGGIARATSPTFVTPALGTPASGVATNLTGTAAGLTAGLVTAAGAATFTDTNGIITGTTIDAALQEVFQGAHDVSVNATTGATETLAVEPAHKMTMDQSCTFTFMTPPTLGYTFSLHLLGAFTPTFPASVDWGSGSAPTYVGTGNGSLFVFTTTDTGTTWLGTMAGSAFA